MIPTRITKAHIEDAIPRVIRDGVPRERRSRNYCLNTNGKHLPPKYVISLAHQIATGEWLHSGQFSGGRESNEFLRHRGFTVVECHCGGVLHGPVAAVSPPSTPKPSTIETIPPRPHSERCKECKIRVGQLLERIYGTCVRDHRFGWHTSLTSYKRKSIGSTLRDVARVLEEHRGFGIGQFVKSGVLAGCDYWVPDPGFIVEFDESQHFTTPRRLALSVYADMVPSGFSAKRWMELCERHNARDNDPAYRDEQRAWYDTLRDLVPSIKGMKPTVRLYARDRVWCSFNPESARGRERFVHLMGGESPLSNRTTEEIRSPLIRSGSTLRVAMVFPQVTQTDIPKAASFAGETVDFVLFPEGYISTSDQVRAKALKKLASELGAPLLVGATDKSVDSTGRCWQVILRFDPDGSRSRVYTKHSTAGRVAFERPDWEPRSMLPTFELGGVTAGATICHDHYLGLLPRYLAEHGARLWVNPSYDNVTDIKWSSVLRLRAVENRFFALCTLHCDVNKRRTHPFAFAPDGSELSARQAGSRTLRPLSECCEAQNVYMIDLDMDMVGEPLDWSKLPPAERPKKAPPGMRRKPVHVSLRGGQPAVRGCSGWSTSDSDFRVECDHGSVYIGFVPRERILDAAACFRVLENAQQMNCAPIIWNHWERLPADSARLAKLMKGRAIECCAPIVISDRDGIHELIELANNLKIPVRRVVESSGDAILDIQRAWGMDNAFKMVTNCLRADLRRIALDRYLSLS